MLEESKLEEKLKEYEALLEKLEEASSSKELYIQLRKLEPLALRFKEYKKVKEEILQTEDLLKRESELKVLAEEELCVLNKKREDLEKELSSLIIEEKQKEQKKPLNSLIFEIRSGTGGEEAALFSADLFRMYIKYCQEKNWHYEVLSAHPTELNGFKEIIFAIEGEGVEVLKYEGGIHRVQRVPKTEAHGRIHTSAVSVAVLPEPKVEEIKINEKDLKIEVFRASGPGGQHVNVTDSAVRITHLPTGITVSCQDERSQYKNKTKALRVLKARLAKYHRDRMERERQYERALQVKSGDRSEKIRTYNFPQNRITDHRINKSFYQLEEMLDGKLEPLICSLNQELAETEKR
jgi:peptide chain release factor 1